MKTPKLQWIKQLGTVASDFPMALATDGYSNIIMAGYSYGDLEQGNRKDSADIWIIKYSSNGQLIWQQQFGSPAFEMPLTLAIDSEDNILIGGDTRGALKAGKKIQNLDGWLAKFSSKGDQLWLRQINIGQEEAVNALAADDQNNVYAGIVAMNDESGYEEEIGQAYLVKYNTEGERIWRTKLTDYDRESPRGVVVDVYGNIYVVGNTQSAEKTGVLMQDIGVFLAKYNAQGEQIWYTQLGSEFTDFAEGIGLDDDQQVFITGFTYNNLTGEKIKTEKPDAWIAKYSQDGQQLWIQQLSAINIENAWNVATTPTGDAIITGSASSQIPGTLTWKSNGWMAKYNKEGQRQWLLEIGSDQYDNATAVAVDGLNNIYLAGYTLGALTASENKGQVDIWLAKYQENLPVEKQVQLLSNYWQNQFALLRKDMDKISGEEESSSVDYANLLYIPLLEAATELTKGQGDGRISLGDAKELWAQSANFNVNRKLISNTFKYIRTTFNVNKTAEEWLAEQMGD